MNRPIIICEDSFQVAWAEAILALRDNSWKGWNIVVQVDSPELFYIEIDHTLKRFAAAFGLLYPKHVAHTIFPQTFFKENISRERLYEKYWRFFIWSRKKPHSGWGTYFERMINYATPEGNVDQLGSIIDNIKNRYRNYGASYTMVIPYPHRDINKLMGAPCLNYITVQVEKPVSAEGTRSINLLAVYRNHDFTERAYGNYLGLCNLLKYIAYETNSQVGTMTCVSSHAFIPKNKSELVSIAHTILSMEV